MVGKSVQRHHRPIVRLAVLLEGNVETSGPVAQTPVIAPTFPDRYRLGQSDTSRATTACLLRCAPGACFTSDRMGDAAALLRCGRNSAR